MSNKKIGSDFEKQTCEMLAREGYWVHFIVPDRRGAQPFDIIAVKDGKALAIDCKTCVSKYFTIDRLEDNQIMAFERWLKCGNEMPKIYILHNEKIIIVDYDELKEKRRIKL